MLNKYPVNVIAKNRIPTKIISSFNLMTFLSIIISGSERPITAIMNARAVPIAIPLDVSTSTMSS